MSARRLSIVRRRTFHVERAGKGDASGGDASAALAATGFGCSAGGVGGSLPDREQPTLVTTVR
jgi:hypothetical protein